MRCTEISTSTQKKMVRTLVDERSALSFLEGIIHPWLLFAGKEGLLPVIPGGGACKPHNGPPGTFLIFTNSFKPFYFLIPKNTKWSGLDKFVKYQKSPAKLGRCEVCGEGGIRTPGTVASTPHFECDPFNHSGTSPLPELKGRR